MNIVTIYDADTRDPGPKAIRLEAGPRYARQDQYRLRIMHGDDDDEPRFIDLDDVGVWKLVALLLGHLAPPDAKEERYIENASPGALAEELARRFRPA